MAKQRSSVKSLIITDDEEVQGEELNPFSFKEFLRWKNQDPDQDQDQDPDQDQDQDETHRKVWRLQHLQQQQQKKMFMTLFLSLQASSSLTFDPELSSCFFSEPSLCQVAPQEEDEEWGQSFLSGVAATEEEETRFSSKPEDQLTAAGENYEGDDETSISEPISCRRRSRLQQLKEENVSLRRSIRELQRRSEANERRVAVLSEEMLQRRRQEEKEAQDLESMVHSVEQNLSLMTKRAVKAENCVTRLKLELQQLQVESLRSENDSLKSAESEVVMTMRRNAQMASEYLKKTASHAHSSIRHLLGEAETLHLVSQLLQSIDKISELNTES
ncbi:hypothetical protein PAMA_017797 [Pampus argenteus]